MEQINIKGMCEYCGFAYEGAATLNADGVRILCPSCNKETSNFDGASDVDALNKAEKNDTTYSHVEKFETATA